MTKVKKETIGKETFLVEVVACVRETIDQTNKSIV